MFAGLAFVAVVLFAGFIFEFVVVVVLVVVVLVVVVEPLPFDIVFVVVVFDALVLVLFAALSPQAMPKAPITRTAESAITFLILF